MIKKAEILGCIKLTDETDGVTTHIYWTYEGNKLGEVINPVKPLGGIYFDVSTSPGTSPHIIDLRPKNN